MLRLTEIKLPLDHPPEAIANAAIARLKIAPEELISCTVFRRAHDARKKSAILLIYSLDVDVKNEAAVLKRFEKDVHVKPTPNIDYQFVARAPAALSSRPLVIGAGPCGLFAALLLAQMGFRPIILERGKVVRERTKDTWGLWRKSVLNPESNVQYGEGGAGTFSDGKLYSQIKDPRHLGRKVLTEFVKAEAPPEILTEAHPHIGTFRLVKMVENMRATIESLGGEYRFESRVTDFDIEEKNGERRVRGVVLASGEHIASDHVVLAVGHSARDTFQMLHERGVYVEAKPFSVGFRIEHPQSLIDVARFGAAAGNPILGAADYKLVHHAANGRDVYSFCIVRRKPRRHQRYEPIFPRRAQRQCGHCGRHHAGGLSRQPTRRNRLPTQVGVGRVHRRWQQLRRSSTTRGRFHQRRAKHVAWQCHPLL